MSTPLEQKALLALRQYSLFTQGDRIAVGVSGGADSVALLRFLAVLREEYRWELIVCHIHHGLRGAEADRDEQFVRELAGQLGLLYAVRHIDAAALALENHLSAATPVMPSLPKRQGRGGASPPPTPWMIPLKRC